MLETAVAQLLFAYSMMTGRRCSLWSVETFARAAHATRHEFGMIGAEGAEMMQGPTLDPETGRELQLRRFRAQAQRAARDTAYYAELFAALEVEPAKLTWDDLQRLPLTTKDAVRNDGDAFVVSRARPFLPRHHHRHDRQTNQHLLLELRDASLLRLAGRPCPGRR